MSRRVTHTLPGPRPGRGRRSFLLSAAGVAGAATGLGLSLGSSQRPAAARSAGPPALATATGGRRLAPGGPAVPAPGGTTLRTVSAPTAPEGGSGYRRLAEGPGWQRVVRTELADARPGRAGSRTALASFVQLTDLHITDVQHPLRSEYLRDAVGSGWRPQEALTVPGTVALIERINALAGGPGTGAALTLAVTTGDNTDNNSGLELEWYLTAMSGGVITPNSGDPDGYEGVQNSGNARYWQPESGRRDIDKEAAGFPRIDGYLAAATRAVRSPGLDLPWYSTVGNHDMLPGGCYAARQSFFADFAVGDKKLMTLPDAEAAPLFRALKAGTDPRGQAFEDMLRAQLRGGARGLRTVTPDPRRAPFTPREYVAAHLAEHYAGQGPVGHGYTEANRLEGSLYYDFRISEEGRGVIGISLDSTDPGGDFRGSVGTAQLRWLERKLEEHRGAHVLVFSHHTSTTMDNTNPDPTRPGERRHSGEEVLALLQRHPQVVAWINGHSHRNAITPRGSLWEVTTASHIDFPQLARVIELADNGDGTLSLFTTLIEAAAPYGVEDGDAVQSQRGLAALYRELAFNARRPAKRKTLAGAPSDRNTELLLPRR